MWWIRNTKKICEEGGNTELLIDFLLENKKYDIDVMCLQETKLIRFLN